MFDLDQAVIVWSRGTSVGRCGGQDQAAEIADHLWCEIERARAEGVSDEQAFAIAVSKLGPLDSNAESAARPRSFRRLLCAVAAYDRRLGAAAGPDQVLLMAHAAIWAAVMLASALLLPKTIGRDSTNWLLLGVIVPGWWGSELILRSALRGRRTGLRT